MRLRIASRRTGVREWPRLTLVLLSILAAHGQEPAGGSWTRTILSDKFTDKRTTIFTLRATEPLSDGLSTGFPNIEINCGTEKGPHYYGVLLSSPVLIKSDLDHEVLVEWRADQKRERYLWGVWDDLRHAGPMKGPASGNKSTLRGILGSQTFRIRFPDLRGHEQVAVFSPANLNMDMLFGACGKI
jgi:hypothetical protein